MKRRFKVLLKVVGVLALSIAAWFGWGAWNGSRFDERLAAMYADGSLRSFETLQGPPVRDADNGYALLQESDELAREIESRIFEELLEEGTTELRYTPDERADWTPEQVEHERRVLRELAPVFVKLDEALQRRAFLRLGTAPLDSQAFIPFLGTFQRLLRRMRMEPARYADDVDRMLTLLDRWDVRDGGDASIRAVLWRTLVLRALREGVEGGHIGRMRRAPWDAILLREEARVLVGVGLSEAWNRAVLLWLVEAWRRYEDPLAEMRSSLGSVGNVLAFVEPDAEGDAVAQLGDLVQRARHMGTPPWYASWYGRPLLEHRAHEMLDTFASEPDAPVTLEEHRAAALLEDPTLAYGARSLMHTLAALRLARVALAVRGAIERGVGKPFDLRVGVAARLGGQHLHDALGDELFVLETRDKHVVVTVRPSRALEALNADYATLDGEAREAALHEDLLLWRIPVP